MGQALSLHPGIESQIPLWGWLTPSPGASQFGLRPRRRWFFLDVGCESMSQALGRSTCGPYRFPNGTGGESDDTTDPLFVQPKKKIKSEIVKSKRPVSFTDLNTIRIFFYSIFSCRNLNFCSYSTFWDLSSICHWEAETILKGKKTIKNQMTPICQPKTPIHVSNLHKPSHISLSFRMLTSSVSGYLHD